MAANHYRFGKRLAMGATGEVYRGEFVGSGVSRPVAIKLLRAGLESQGQVAARMRDEARMVSWLRHPSIARVEDFCTFEGRLAVIMELVDGVDFAAVRNEYGPLPARAVAEVLVRVADALHEAWTRPGPDGTPLRIVHRDIKPENIALDVFGQVKVLDFGAARASFEGREAETRDLVPGTLPYMAPERFTTDDGGVFGSPASDIWALGATLVELLLGCRWSHLRRDARGAPADIVARQALTAAGAPGPLQVLLVSMLALQPEDRPSAEEVAQAGHEMVSLPGASLRGIARQAVEAGRGKSIEVADDRLGTMFAAASAPSNTPALPAGASDVFATRPVPVRAGLMGLAATVLFVAGGGCLIGAVALATYGKAEPPVAPIEVPAKVVEVPPAVEPEVEPPPVVEPPAPVRQTTTRPPKERVTEALPTPVTPPPEPPPAPRATTFVSKKGDATSVWLEPGSLSLPRSVPPGRYTPHGIFADGEHKGEPFDLGSAPMEVRCYNGTCRAKEL